ncbi:MAG TPA: hypothetical protein VGB95_05315 [Chitinophagales bacterium]
MKHLLVTLTTITTLAIAISSCSHNNNQNDDLNNPNSLKSLLTQNQGTGVWVQDSTTFTSPTGQYVVSLADTGEILKFTADSISDTYPDGSSETLPYTLQDSTLNINGSFYEVKSVSTTSLHFLNPDTKDVFYHAQ